MAVPEDSNSREPTPFGHGAKAQNPVSLRHLAERPGFFGTDANGLPSRSGGWLAGPSGPLADNRVQKFGHWSRAGGAASENRKANVAKIRNTGCKAA